MEKGQQKPKAILALCLGNICRSPIAEGLLRVHVEKAGLQITIDSAGTSGYHAGEAPDSRSIEVMKHHGYDISMQRSRQLTKQDFQRFDLILAMDESNVRNARRLAQSDEEKNKVQLLLEGGAEVPDPYYGGQNGFETVYQMIEQAVLNWIALWRPW